MFEAEGYISESATIFYYTLIVEPPLIETSACGHVALALEVVLYIVYMYGNVKYMAASIVCNRMRIHRTTVPMVPYSPRFLRRPMAFFDLLEPWDVRELSISKTADLPVQLWTGTFPRFVAIRFYFLSKTLI